MAGTEVGRATAFLRRLPHAAVSPPCRCGYAVRTALFPPPFRVADERCVLPPQTEVPVESGGTVVWIAAPANQHDAEQGADAAAAARPIAPDTVILEALMEMGFTENAAKRAAIAVPPPPRRGRTINPARVDRHRVWCVLCFVFCVLWAGVSRSKAPGGCWLGAGLEQLGQLGGRVVLQPQRGPGLQ